jgi:hypothetical protein
VTLPYSRIIQVFIAVAWQQTRRGDAFCHGSVWFGSALLGTAQRKHHFVYCCVIMGACFDVTVLAWRKYTTISFIFNKGEYFVHASCQDTIF